MCSKIKTIVSTALVFIAGILGFIGGIFLYGKYMDKPEMAVTNETNVDIGKVKSKDGNVSVSLPVPEHSEYTATSEVIVKKKFRLFNNPAELYFINVSDIREPQ